MSRNRVYKARSRLKDDCKNQPSQIYINEDITKTASTLFYHCRNAKKENRIFDTWIYDGKVLIKQLNGRIANVQQISDIN